MGMYRNADLVVKKCHDRFATRLYCHLGAVLAKGSYLLALRRRLRK